MLAEAITPKAALGHEIVASSETAQPGLMGYLML